MGSWQARYHDLIAGKSRGIWPAAQRLGLAGVCQVKKLHHTAAGLYAAAFAANPRLADDPKAGHRYNAACDAALAAAGQGEDAAKLDDQEKARLRKQALDWLRADLALRTKQLESGQPAEGAVVQRAMRHWQQDSDLAGVRGEKALAVLPETERQAWSKLWAEVEAARAGATRADREYEPQPPRSQEVRR